jgi:hypothetical protein
MDVAVVGVSIVKVERRELRLLFVGIATTGGLPSRSLPAAGNRFQKPCLSPQDHNDNC